MLASIGKRLWGLGLGPNKSWNAWLTDEGGKVTVLIKVGGGHRVTTLCLSRHNETHPKRNFPLVLQVIWL